MQSDWEDRKGRFPINYLFDGMCLDTFLTVSRIEFVVFCFVFVLLLGAFDTREWGRRKSVQNGFVACSRVVGGLR